MEDLLVKEFRFHFPELESLERSWSRGVATWDRLKLAEIGVRGSC